MGFDRVWGRCRSSWKWLAAISVLASLAVLAAVAGPARLEQALRALGRFPPRALALAAAIVLLQMLLQASRLYALLPREPGRSWIDVVRAFSLGQLANSRLPARAGDALKIARIGSAGEERASALARAAGGVLVADKVVDLAALGILVALVGTRWLSGALGWVARQGWVLGLLAALAAAAVVVPENGRRSGTGRTFRQFVRGTAGLADPRRVAGGLALGMAAWLAEASVLGLLASSLGLELDAAQRLWILAALNLGIALPVTVANIGTFEAALVVALGRAGVGVPEAIAIAVAHHAFQIAGVGGLALGSRVPLAVGRAASRTRPDAFRARPADKQRAVAFYDALSGEYERVINRGLLGTLRDRERSIVLRIAELGDAKARTMVDVGCGPGFYAIAAKRAGKWVCALDLAPRMVERVRPHVDTADIADVELLDADRRYDIVLCSGVLEFVADPDTAFANLCRLTAPGGRLIVLVPRACVAGLAYRVEKRFAGIRVNLYTREWLADIAGRFGLTLTVGDHPLPTNMVLRFDRCADGAIDAMAKPGGESAIVASAKPCS